MTIKFTIGELAELERHATGEFGQKNFHSFMSEVFTRTDEDTGEVDLGRDDLERIQDFKRKGHKKRVEAVFKRPVEAALKKFFG